MDTPRTDKAEPQGFLIGQSDYVRMRELSAEQEKVKQLHSAIVNAKSLDEVRAILEKTK